MIKNQNFGIEIELTGIKREEAAKVIAEYYHTQSFYIGTGYGTYGAKDSKGRTWQAMSDGSITTTRKVRGTQVSADNSYSCEIVSPILQYDDLDDLQEIVRALRKIGAVANSSCGIHVHIDGVNHNNDSITRLVNFACARQDLFYDALNVGARADQWCHKTSGKLLTALKKDSIKTKSSLENIWYSPVNDGYTGGVDHRHYNSTRYHGINLHAFFTKGTVEFRLFNGTTHAGEIKSYIQFCLAMSAWAVTAQTTKLYFKGCSDYTQEQKYTLMMNVLTKRLGMVGPEFKSARLHLTKVFAPAETITAA